jgi:hypothetical protein
VGPELDRIAMKSISRKPEDRFRTAREMALELEAAVRPASTNQVAAWLVSIAGPAIDARTALVAEVENQAGEATASLVRRLVGSTVPRSEPARLVQLPSLGEGGTLTTRNAVTTRVEGAPGDSRLVVGAGIVALALAVLGAAKVAASRGHAAPSSPPPGVSVAAPASAPPPPDEAALAPRAPPIDASSSESAKTEPSASAPAKPPQSKYHGGIPASPPSGANRVKSTDELIDSPSILNQH